MVALPEGTVFLMCVPARMPDLRSLGYISGVCSRRPKSARCPLGTRTLQEKQEQRDLETRHEKTPLYSNFRETHLLGTPVVLVGHPGSGFCARIARLRRSRDAGVTGAEPRIRDDCDIWYYHNLLYNPHAHEPCLVGCDHDFFGGLLRPAVLSIVVYALFCRQNRPSCNHLSCFWIVV